MKFWSKLEKWVSNATIADIVCHTDSDGLTAGAQLALYLKSKGVGHNVILGSPERLRLPSFWRRLKNDLVFFVDLPADHSYEELIKLSGRANIVIVDHHKIMHDANSDSIIHYYREFLGEEKYYPASKMVYDLFGGVDWMAVIGLIGDYGGKPWKEFINKVHKKYGFPECVDENCFDSPFSKYDQLISSARMMLSDKGCFKVFSILFESGAWNEFTDKASVLEEWANQVNDYIKHIRSDYLINRVIKKNAQLIFYELSNPVYKIGSALATIISTDEPNRTIVILTCKGDVVNANFRRQDGLFDMSELAMHCAKSVGGSGGGHREAAGATINSESIDEFKNCIAELMLKWLSNS